FLFCILSGTMITVSASAIRIPFGIAPQTKWYPEDMRFVLIVLLVGAVVVSVAILGFKRLAQFSEICVPWLFVMFIAGAIGTLPVLANATPGVGSIDSFAELWRIAQEKIWLRNSESGLGIWHIAAFAWICNLAFHIGLSDMAILRYAPRASYGLYSACGMYLGHYLAWVCAGVMGASAALILQRPLAELDAGEVAFQALGLSGILAVILAGWATSNPTLYRAGLALQAVTPGWPRWLVTLLAGIATTAIACFPFVFTKLLSFVALFGILLSPVGAIVFVEHWLFPYIGLRQYWFSATGKSISWPALLAWLISVGIAMGLWYTEMLHEFFIAIPLWFVSALLYTAFAIAAGARSAGPLETAEVARSQRSAVAVRLSCAHRRPGWLVAMISLAWLILLFQLAVSVWLLTGEYAAYVSRLATYRVWLAATSLLHLTMVAVCVIAMEKVSVDAETKSSAK
ncbi:MAG: hypothetical protein ABI557_16040, partial [Aureliella sp.]